MAKTKRSTRRSLSGRALADLLLKALNSKK